MNQTIRFYPRDIGLWRKTFTWNGISEPSKVFDSELTFEEFLSSHGIRFDDPENPFTISPCGNYIWGKQFSVVQWSCIGWINYE